MTPSKDRFLISLALLLVAGSLNAQQSATMQHSKTLPRLVNSAHCKHSR
jgi:hypothetical protein